MPAVFLGWGHGTVEEEREEKEKCKLVCRRRPAICGLLTLNFLIFGTIAALCFGLTSTVTIPAQYPATLLPSADFSYNFTSSTAQFSIWQYIETRHYTNTSTITGIQDPQYNHYSFVSNMQTGCCYYGYPLVLGVGPGKQKNSQEPQGDNSLQLTSPGCAALIANRVFGILLIPVMLVSSVAVMLALVQMFHRVGSIERGERTFGTEFEHERDRYLFNTAVMVGVTTAVCLPLIVCVVVWAMAPAFKEADGQWDSGVYLFFLTPVYIIVLQWSSVWYCRSVGVELRRKMHC